MKNEDAWAPTRFVRRAGTFRASRDRRHVARGSRFILDLLGPVYADRLARHARGRLLDLGCGPVPLYEMYRPHVDQVTCADRAADGASHLDHHLDLDDPLPFSGGAFDTVVLTSVLEHVARPHALMAETARVLRPGGKLILSAPFVYPVHEAPNDHFRFTAFALRRLAADAGLDVVELDPAGGVLEVLADITGKLVARSAALSAAHLAAAKAMTASAPGRWAFRRTAAEWPLVHVLVAAKGRG